MHTEAHLFSVPNDCLWYDKLWGPSQRVVTLFQNHDVMNHESAIYQFDSFESTGLCLPAERIA